MEIEVGGAKMVDETLDIDFDSILEKIQKPDQINNRWAWAEDNREAEE